MQTKKILAPYSNAETLNHLNAQEDKPTSSIKIKLKCSKKEISKSTLEENDLRKSLVISKSKEKAFRRMKAKRKILSQEEKVLQLLNQINNHINGEIGNNLTVADLTGKYKPIFKEFESLPLIHFNDVNNTKYHQNPFSTLNSYYSTTNSKYSSSDQEEVDNSDLNLLSENDNMVQSNYCGHCKKHFISGRAHRLSGFHQLIISDPKHWKKIDNLYNQFKKA